MNPELKTILVDHMKLDEATLRPEATMEEAGLDSVGVMELAVLIEDRFGLTVSDDELADIGTVGQLDHFLEHRRVRGAGRP